MVIGQMAVPTIITNIQNTLHKGDKMENNKRYRVEVVEIETNKVVAVIGHNLTEKQAERRIETGLLKFNPELVYIRDVEEK